MNPLKIWASMDRQDRYILVSSSLVPLALWWFYIGRNKYSMKGQR